MKDSKQKKREYKELAQHITYTDTLNNQDLLRKRVEDLRRHNECIKISDRTAYLRELSKALFTQGTVQKVYLTVKHGRIPLGENLHHFGNQMGYVHTNRVELTHSNKTYEVDIFLLWDALLQNLLIVFPYAQAESMRRSAEREKYESGGSLSYVPTKRY